MKIKVLGTGCSSCKTLYKNVEEVIVELKMDIELEKVEAIEKIMEYGIMSVPALVINEEVKFSGKVPNKEQLKELILNDKCDDNAPTCNCSNC